MLTINANTKIAEIIDQHPDALDAIVSISSRFERLRNPILRKLMAGKASIAMASKIGGCTINTFFEKLKPLGFEIDALTIPVSELKKEEGWEATLAKFDTRLQTIDVRNLEMPLPMMNILEALEKLSKDTALFIYHKRIPLFLLPELAERKFDHRIKQISEGEVHILIFKS